MNDTQQSTACLCTTCPGASCGCACQNVPSQATTQAACACGAQCQCGPSCSCAKS